MSNLKPDMGLVAQIGRALRLADPFAHATLVATCRPVEGFRPDVVAVVRYLTRWRKGHRWAVVQRVGPMWSATLNLEREDAGRRAIAIARRNDASRPEEAQVEGRTDDSGTPSP